MENLYLCFNPECDNEFYNELMENSEEIQEFENYQSIDDN